MRRIDWEGVERRRENGELFHFAASLSKTFLPAGYEDYRERVQRWRDRLEVGGMYLEDERKARLKADIVFKEAAADDRALKEIEAATGWKRPEAME